VRRERRRDGREVAERKREARHERVRIERGGVR
jgi:hypothetical protein